MLYSYTLTDQLAYWWRLTDSTLQYLLPFFVCFIHPLLSQNLAKPEIINQRYKFCNKKISFSIETYTSPLVKNANNIGRILNNVGDTTGLSSTFLPIVHHTLSCGTESYCSEVCLEKIKNTKQNCLLVMKPTTDYEWIEMGWLLNRILSWRSQTCFNWLLKAEWAVEWRHVDVIG